MKSRNETYAASFSRGVVRFGISFGFGLAVLFVASSLTRPTHAEIIDDDTPIPAVGELGGLLRARTWFRHPNPIRLQEIASSSPLPNISVMNNPG